MTPKLNDVVRTLRTVEDLPSGQVGTVVDVTPHWLLVEVCDGMGRTLHVLGVQPEEVEVTWSSPR